MRYVRIPSERLGVVIGPDGRTRKQIEKRTGVKLIVDSTENEVRIDDSEPSDPLAPLKAEDVVRAIGRGFSPERAFKLFSDEMYFQLFDLHDYAGKDRKDVQRLASRVIGSEGKTRRIIEDLTGAFLSVYGHTVGIIGDAESIETAKTAVDMILSGSEHAAVYRFLEGKRRETRRERMSGF
jgi:ribosomal RNA assembly protein